VRSTARNANAIGYSVASELVTYVLWLLLPFSVAIASSQALVARGHFT